MNFLDWILIILVGAYALSGYWQGFITGAFATGGLLLGGFIGIWLAPKVLGSAAPSLWVSLGALFIVIACASIGQAVLQYGGVRVRDEITWQPARMDRGRVNDRCSADQVEADAQRQIEMRQHVGKRQIRRRFDGNEDQVGRL